MAAHSIQISAGSYLSLMTQIEALERSFSALRGAVSGLHCAIDQNQVSGEDLETLLQLLTDRLFQQSGTLTDTMKAVRHGG